MILHAIHPNCNTIAISARDTDVLLLIFIYNIHEIDAKVFMMAGTSKKPKIIPVNKILEKKFTYLESRKLLAY